MRRREVSRPRTHEADAVPARDALAARARTVRIARCASQLDRMVIPRAEPVAQHERRDPHRVEVVGRLAPFEVHREPRVRAAGRDDHGRHRRPCSRHVHRQGRLVAILVALRAWRAPSRATASAAPAGSATAAVVVDSRDRARSGEDQGAEVMARVFSARKPPMYAALDRSSDSAARVCTHVRIGRDARAASHGNTTRRDDEVEDVYYS